MKKIISLFAALLVAAGVMTVTSCATSHDDLEAVAIPAYIVGGFKNSKGIEITPVVVGNAPKDNNFYPLTYTDGVAEFAFTQDSDAWATGYPTDTMTFKLALSDSWNTTWGKTEFELNADYKEVESSSDNCTVKGLVQGNKYKISIKMDGSKVTVKVTGEAAAPTAAPDADVSALNSKNAKQKGAYFRIGGDSFSVSAQQVFFNSETGKATGYITVPKDANDGWNAGYFQLYAYFGAGDNGSTLKNKEAQVYFPKTTLGASAKISSEKDESKGINNLQVTDMKIDKSATKVYKFVVETTSEGATITVSAVE